MALSLLKKPKKTISETSSATVSSSYSDYEVRSGLMVVTAVITLIALLFIAGKSQLFQKTREVKISFNYIGGLTKNAPVLFAGHKSGRVTKIEFTPNAESLILVTALIDQSIPVRVDSDAYIDTLGFMGEKYLAMAAGTSRDSAFLEKDAVLKGTDPLPVMEMVKKGTEILGEFEKTSKSLDVLLQELHGIAGENRTELSQILQNLNASSANLKDMTADLKTHPWKLLRKNEPGKRKKFLVI